MPIILDHTIVPAKDKVASARFFAEIFGLTVKPGQGYFTQVQVNDSLTFDFADEPNPRSHHYAFHISEAEFEEIFGRVKAKGITYGSGPYNHADGQIYTRRGGRRAIHPETDDRNVCKQAADSEIYFRKR